MNEIKTKNAGSLLGENKINHETFFEQVCWWKRETDKQKESIINQLQGEAVSHLFSSAISCTVSLPELLRRSEWSGLCSFLLFWFQLIPIFYSLCFSSFLRSVFFFTTSFLLCPFFSLASMLDSEFCWSFHLKECEAKSVVTSRTIAAWFRKHWRER